MSGSTNTNPPATHHLRVTQNPGRTDRRELGILFAVSLFVTLVIGGATGFALGNYYGYRDGMSDVITVMGRAADNIYLNCSGTTYECQREVIVSTWVSDFIFAVEEVMVGDDQ